MNSTILIIRYNKEKKEVFTKEFKYYEEAAEYAFDNFNKIYYEFHFYRKTYCKNGDILLKWFCSCQGGQEK